MPPGHLHLSIHVLAWLLGAARRRVNLAEQVHQAFQMSDILLHHDPS